MVSIEADVQLVCIKALLTIRACLKMLSNPQQSLRFSRDETREEEKKEAVVRLKELFTDDFLRTIMDILIRRYFVLCEKELAEWENESEEWERREEGEGEDLETSIRICAEKLFLDVAISHKSLTIQPLVTAFQSISSPDNEDVLLKDSIYTAVGLAAPVLHESIDFDSFIQNTLAIEAKKQQ